MLLFFDECKIWPQSSRGIQLVYRFGKLAALAQLAGRIEPAGDLPQGLQHAAANLALFERIDPRNGANKVAGLEVADNIV